MKKTILFFLIFIFAACGEKEATVIPDDETNFALAGMPFDETDGETEIPVTAQDVTVSDDGVLRLHMRPPMTLNPLLNEDVTVDKILGLIFEPLAVLDNAFRVTGYLADLDFASDFGSVNAVIRESAVWSDGMPVTADDIIFSIEFLRAAPDSAIYKENIAHIASAVRVDSRTVQIIFERASVTSGYCLTFPIIPQHYYQSESEINMNPLGSGCFMFDSLSLRSMSLVRNPLNPGRIAEAEIIFLPDAETDFYAFEHGRLDAFHLPLTEWTQNHGVRSPGYQVFPAMYFEFIGFNFRRNIFRDVLTRQGIAHAFNADEAVANLYLSYAARSATPVHPYNWAADNDLRNPVYDPQRAAALLGTIRLDNPLVIIANAENPQRVSIAERLAQSLTDAGLAAAAEILTNDEYFARLDAHDFDLFIGGMELSSAPDVQIFFRGRGLFVHDPILENAYSALVYASSETAYISAMGRLQQVFCEQLPVIGLAFKHSALLTSPRVSNNINPAPGHIFANINEWFIDT